MADEILPAVMTTASPWGDTVPTFTYLAGAAGSGKTFLTKLWQEEEGRKLLLCATTGIAAINLGGSTINAVLGFFDTKSLQDKYVSGQLTAHLGRLWKSGVRRLVLDEVSMLDGDQLTILVRAIDELNGRGYVLDKQTDDIPAEMGLTLVGDFAQLPPVKAPFAFESPEWHRFQDHTITLTEIRRQADPQFIEALRAARKGEGHRAIDYFRDDLQEVTSDTFDGTTIFARNESVDRYNQIRFDQVTADTVYYPSTRWGKQRSEWGNPEKPAHTWGIPERLAVKEGALVMILANTWAVGPPPKRAIYVNGDLGVVTEAVPEKKYVRVLLHRTSEEVSVEYVTREVLIPCDSARRQELRDLGQADRIRQEGKFECTGEITYMPLRLAYASTVHKAQGLSLDKVQVNLRDPFFKSCGMVYVALSRARTAPGLRLVGSPAAFIERCTSDPRLKGWL